MAGGGAITSEITATFAEIVAVRCVTNRPSYRTMCSFFTVMHLQDRYFEAAHLSVRSTSLSVSNYPDVCSANIVYTSTHFCLASCPNATEGRHTMRGSPCCLHVIQQPTADNGRSIIDNQSIGINEELDWRSVNGQPGLIPRSIDTVTAVTCN